MSTILAALAVGFLIGTGVVVGRSEAEVQDARKQALIEVIRERQAHVAALAGQLDELRGRVAEVEAATSAGAAAMQGSLGLMEQAAGLRGLSGPGLRVTLDDARDRCRGAQPEDCRIQDVDLQLVVNALFDAGAEGVSVGGERLVATTAIRSAGGAVLVNYRVLAAPYVVEAVGHPERVADRFAASGIAGEFALWSETYGLGFVVEPADELVLPPYSGALRVRHARPAENLSTGGAAP